MFIGENKSDVREAAHIGGNGKRRDLAIIVADANPVRVS
jgi:hypothetical protein